MGYPGNLLRSIKGEHVIESNNWQSWPPNELERLWIAEFRMTQPGFDRASDSAFVAQRSAEYCQPAYMYSERKSVGDLECSGVLSLSSADGDKMWHALFAGLANRVRQ
jgi:hypothetical protein